MNIEGDNLHDIHRDLMDRFTPEGGTYIESAPRGKPIREYLGARIVLTNPRARLIASPARLVNYGFAAGELCWYLRGNTDLETMLYYNKRMGQFSNDGKTINSAYGARMFSTMWAAEVGTRSLGLSQWDNAVAELKSDPHSRRAVMHINQPRDLLQAVERGSKDVPCTLSLQLLIRDRRLHMVVNMRSNDVVWGLPYDIFSFTCLQESFLGVLQEEGVAVDGLGEYIHTAGSLHVYDTHYAMAEEVAGEPGFGPDPMEPITSAEFEIISRMLEPAIRKDPEPEKLWDVDLSESARTMVRWLIQHRKKRDYEAGLVKIPTLQERKEALTELVRLTEEAGGYDKELKEKK